MNNGKAEAKESPNMPQSMNYVQPDTVAYVKTTEEPVFVMAILPNAIALVRRPTSTDTNGVEHRIEFFGLSELQTAEQRIEGEIALSKFTMEARNRAVSEHKKSQETPSEPKEPYLN